MPQLLLEYTDTIIEKKSLSVFFNACHEIISSLLEIDLQYIISRAIEHNQYCIAEGIPTQGFLLLSIKLRAGRPPLLLDQLGEKLKELLKNYFAVSLKKMKVEITVEINELAATFYKVDTL